MGKKTYSGISNNDDALAQAVGRIANAILPDGIAPGHDETGGTVVSLTESIMGVTSGLVAIAHAIQELARAVRQRE